MRLFWGMLFVCVLTIPTAAVTVNLSGMIYDTSGIGIPNIKVSCRKANLSAISDSRGNWNMTDANSEISKRAVGIKVNSERMVVYNNHLFMRFNGRSLVGRSFGTNFGSVSKYPISARLSGDAIDTLCYAWKDSVLLRVPISSYSQENLVAILDTTKSVDSFSKENGDFADSRDEKIYKWVRIGTQVWMGQNLNYSTDSSWCPNGKSGNCDADGRLYSWSSAMGISTKYLNSEWKEVLPNQGACPVGWHVPSTLEWDSLVSFIGKDLGSAALKTINGWSYPSTCNSCAPTDKYGFGAVPAGIRYSDGSYGDFSAIARFWTASQVDSNEAKSWQMNSDSLNAVAEWNVPKTSAISLRCVRDEVIKNVGIKDTATWLSSIAISSGRLSPKFESNVMIYSDTVSYAQAKKITITAVASLNSAKVVINGVVGMGTVSQILNLTKDSIINVIVINGNEFRSYAVMMHVVHDTDQFVADYDLTGLDVPEFDTARIKSLPDSLSGWQLTWNSALTAEGWARTFIFWSDTLTVSQKAALANGSWTPTSDFPKYSVVPAYVNFLDIPTKVFVGTNCPNGCRGNAIPTDKVFYFTVWAQYSDGLPGKSSCYRMYLGDAYPPELPAIGRNIGTDSAVFLWDSVFDQTSHYVTHQFGQLRYIRLRLWRGTSQADSNLMEMQLVPTANNGILRCTTISESYKMDASDFSVSVSDSLKINAPRTQLVILGLQPSSAYTLVISFVDRANQESATAPQVFMTLDADSKK